MGGCIIWVGGGVVCVKSGIMSSKKINLNELMKPTSNSILKDILEIRHSAKYWRYKTKVL